MIYTAHYHLPNGCARARVVNGGWGGKTGNNGNKMKKEYRKHYK
jgi:hypothetical protein